MSHYTPLSEILTERITLLHGALHQGSVTFNTTDSEFSFIGTSIPYSNTDLGPKIEQVNNLISTYKQEEGDHGDLILYLEDIKNILITTQERLSWLP